MAYTIMAKTEYDTVATFTGGVCAMSSTLFVVGQGTDETTDKVVFSCVVYNPDTNTISKKTEHSINVKEAEYKLEIKRLDESKFIAQYKNNGIIYLVMGTINLETYVITLTTPLNTGVGDNIQRSLEVISSTQAILAVADNLYILTIGTDITIGSAYAYYANDGTDASIGMLTSTRGIIYCVDSSLDFVDTVRLFDVNGTEISFIDAVPVGSKTNHMSKLAILSPSKAIAYYNDASNHRVTMAVLDISGDTITVGPLLVIVDNSLDSALSIVGTSATTFVSSRTERGSNTTYFETGSVSGTTITLSSLTSAAWDVSTSYFPSITKAPDSNTIAFVMPDPDATKKLFITIFYEAPVGGTNNIYVGNINIASMYVGSTAVSKVYVGSTVVYEV